MMDYNKINDDELDVIEFTEFEAFKKELLLDDVLSNTNNLPKEDNEYKNESNAKNTKFKKTRKREKTTVKCEICGYCFHSNVIYERHKFNHFRERFLQCNVCGKLSNNRLALINHIKSNHLNIKGERQDCKICGKSVVQIDIHMRNHINANFKCDKCKKCFRSNSYYIEHYKTHFAAKEFHCKICGGAFMRKHYLNVHMAKHAKLNKEFQSHIRANRNIIREENNNVDQRTVACDTSDLQSNITDDVIVFPLRKSGENQVIPSSNMTSEKWTKALFSSQSVDTSDIDYYLDLLGQSSV